MSLDIQEVLNRRSDLSTFVVHLTRDTDQPAKENLKAIISEGLLRAKTRYGWAKDVPDHPDVPGLGTQRVVCFTETPLEHIYSHVAPIKNRQVKLEPYGLAFTKMQARRRAVNPVWYVDESPGRDWIIAHALDELRDAAKSADFHHSHVAKVLPFIEPMGAWQNSKREFWWEREWRHVDTMNVDVCDVAFYLCPEADIAELESVISGADGCASKPTPPCLDPRWGLEQIVARLLQLEPGDISPFT